MHPTALLLFCVVVDRIVRVCFAIFILQEGVKDCFCKWVKTNVYEMLWKKKTRREKDSWLDGNCCCGDVGYCVYICLCVSVCTLAWMTETCGCCWCQESSCVGHFLETAFVLR